tara:strand:- start:127 stop:288 length:162 start_codon:yes stop_codon:yes gene_type:complete
MNNIWYYLTSEDMRFYKSKVSKELYWKLSAQCRARIPMLKSVYIKLQKQYTDE